MRYNSNGVIGEIDNLPGCSQVAVFHSVFVLPDERGQRKGINAHVDRILEAERLGYDAAICTVNLANKAQLRILEEHQWKCVHQFTSLKTENRVGIFVRDI